MFRPTPAHPILQPHTRYVHERRSEVTTIEEEKKMKAFIN
jgi:hypothetical protein